MGADRARCGLRFATSVCLTLALTGCSPGYVLRAGYEEAKILWRRQPIDELLQRGTVDPATREKLALALRVRRFADASLGLNVGGRYSTYTPVDAAQVVHVVTAAERFRLEPYTWWFPIVGRVPYKGYFSQKEARAEAARLEAQAFDTYVRPSAAFSTLGWFDDPLLSTMLGRDRVDLVDTVVHELLHSTSYLGRHPTFDESFANFVGHHGAIAFFQSEKDARGEAQARDNWADARQFSRFISAFADDLRQAYAAGVTADQRPQLFEQAQVRFRELSFRTSTYSGFASIRLNNAIILHQLLYFDRLVLFESVFERNGGDLRVTIATVIDATRRGEADPFAELSRLAASAHTSSADSRRIPSRTETAKTAPASAKAAPSDVATPNITLGENDVS